jgi:sugar phosphate permease
VNSRQRAWRTRVFVATWLSYVGFYFCRKPFTAAQHAIGDQLHWSPTTLGNILAAYLIAYAIGQFLASRVGPWLGPRNNVLIGMALSIAVTAAMGIALSPWLMAGLLAVNGLAQATGWSGNVGTMASWFAKHERGRVMGVWSTNFTVGAIVSGLVMGWVLGAADWPWCFYTGAIVLSVVWVQFYFMQRNRPEDLGLPPIDDPSEAEAVFEETGPLTLSRAAWTNMLIVGGFYFFAKLVRYAIWGWAAYFLHAKYGLDDKHANIYSTVFDVCGVPGVFVTGWISDRFFGSRRAGIALIMMIGMMAATGLLVLFGGASVTVFVVLLGAVGFFLYGPDSLLTGAGAMDIGSRRAATFAAAVISGFGSIGPIVQEVIVPRVYDEKTAGLGPVFGILFASAAMAAVFCLLLVLRNRRGGRGI